MALVYRSAGPLSIVYKYCLHGPFLQLFYGTMKRRVKFKTFGRRARGVGNKGLPASVVVPCLPCAATGRNFDRPGKVCEHCHGRGWKLAKAPQTVPALPAAAVALN